MRIKILALLFLTGCSTVSQPLTPNTIYRHDMDLTINKVKYVGIATVPRAFVYEITANAPSDMDFFIFRTCHREVSTEDVGEKSRYVYIPQTGIEEGACPAEIIGLNKEGKHSFAYVVFNDPEKTLTATVKCNGKVINTDGTSLCQSSASLVQEISFIDEVIMSDAGNASGCALDIPKRGKAFQFAMPMDKCIYTFADPKTNSRHRLFTIGYGEIILEKK